MNIYFTWGEMFYRNTQPGIWCLLYFCALIWQHDDSSTIALLSVYDLYIQSTHGIYILKGLFFIYKGRLS